MKKEVLYDPKNEDVVKFECLAMGNQYIHSDMFGKSPTLVDKLEEIVKSDYEGTAEEELKLMTEFFISQIFSTIVAGQGYFPANDPELAYAMLIDALKDEAIRARVLEHLHQRLRFTELSSNEATQEEKEFYRAHMYYFIAKKKVNGIKRELKKAEEHLRQMHDCIEVTYPSCLDDE